MEFADTDLAGIVEDLGEAIADWSHPTALATAAAAIHRRGLLSDVEVHQIAVPSGEASRFLLALRVSENVTVCSPSLDWHEVMPSNEVAPDQRVQNVLKYLGELTEQLREDFAADAWQKISIELGAVRSIIERTTEAGESGWRADK